jgi:Cu(I)/Ag(I) efflux system membrane fusion protein
MRIKILIAFSLIILLASCNKEVKEHTGHEMSKVPKNNTSKEEIYWCPMDTQIVQNKPGICPICNKDLEIKEHKHAEHDYIQQDLVYNPVNETVLSSVKAIKPVNKSLPSSIKTSGYISYDTRRTYNISSRVEGRIEKLFIKYTYQPISKGQALFEIFSHDLLTAQNEFLYIKKNEADEDILKSAKSKLLLLGMTESQISKLKTEGHVHPTTTVYSPYAGYVIEEKDNSAEYSSGKFMNDAMSQQPAKNSGNKNLELREGAYVKKGAPVFKIANTDIVWAVFEVYSDNLPGIKVGQPIRIALEGMAETIIGKVDFIEPSYKQTSGTTRIRVYLNNKGGKLKIGNLLSGEIETGEKNGLWIPQMAIYDLGRYKVIFLKKNGVFETKRIKVGTVSGDQIEVIAGLTEADEIAENAQFMTDSESFVKVSK